jgi:hypothetical protein
MKKAKHRGAFKAWLCSLPLALGCPTVCWLVSGLLYWDPIPLIIAAVALVVHFFSYLVTGLPIFLRCFRNASSLIWTPRGLIPVGILLGMIAVQFVPLLVGNHVNPMSNPGSYLMGGAYGLMTAIAALRQRPTPG